MIKCLAHLAKSLQLERERKAFVLLLLQQLPVELDGLRVELVGDVGTRLHEFQPGHLELLVRVQLFDRHLLRHAESEPGVGVTVVFVQVRYV